MFDMQSFGVQLAVLAVLLSLATSTPVTIPVSTSHSLILHWAIGKSLQFQSTARSPCHSSSSSCHSAKSSQSARPAPDSSHIIPRVKRGEAGGKQVVRRGWVSPDPKSSLSAALKDWPKG